ncbi:MAG: chloride channel protein [Hyphomicrobiales bacterium]|nr:MAG: chloride channel protein [Hyphomicrobiales bacterium]
MPGRGCVVLSHFNIQAISSIWQGVRSNLRQFLDGRQPMIWLLSIFIGLGVAYAAILFRIGIGLAQLPWLGLMSERIGDRLAALPWWVIVLVPTLTGLIIGLMLKFLMPAHRPYGVADVIEARAIKGGRLPVRAGLLSAAITVISLGGGASAGREGPVVHLGATLASGLARYFELPSGSVRSLLGCGVAAAVAASFNAPIAGALFALEVVLGHYAMRAFVPVVISSTIAAVISRAHLGDFPAFSLPHYHIISYWEFGAFALLGLTCALIAISFQYAAILAERGAQYVNLPLVLRPMAGGLLVGIIGVFFPQILGVGYEATDLALKQHFGLTLLLSLLAAKLAATAITLAARFGGGVFSPSLYLGAMTGGAFGLIAAQAFPDFASSSGLYAILGMGGVAAAVLGAPISTTLIIFELTGGFELAIALLLTISLASGLSQALHGRSFFHWQLGERGLFLTDGPHKHIVRTLRVREFMTFLEDDEAPFRLDPDGEQPWLTPADTLETALRALDRAGDSRVAVIDSNEPGLVIAWASRLDAIELYNKALIQANIEAYR